MIKRLLVKQSSAFDEVIIHPSDKFNIISGVSGSGKSVLMESILALFGLKESNATLIEGSLDNDILDNGNLEDSGILDDDEITLSVLKKDKVKYFINNQTSSKKRIRDIFGDYVQYIHTYSSTFNEHYLLHLLDIIISHKDSSFALLLSSYKENYQQLTLKKNQLQAMQNDEKNIIELKELAKYEIEKIESINPKIDEYEALLQIKKNLSKKEKMLEKIAQSKEVVKSLPTLLHLLDSIDKNKPIFEEVFNEIEFCIKDEEENLLSLDEENIEQILNRLELLSGLIYKYGSIEASLEYLQKKKDDLANYENLTFNKNALEKEIKLLSQSIQSQADDISRTRKENLILLSQRLESYCQSLRLNPIHTHLIEGELSQNGKDVLEFKLGDSHIKTLSSGEFNRLRLATLCVYIEYTKQSGILILDEIDANLSGSESEGVAKILAFLSQSYQIFAISHQPHMTSFANHHYLVKKNEKQKSQIVLLDKNGRIKEVARIISGEKITPEALNFAKEQLKHLK